MATWRLDTGCGASDGKRGSWVHLAGPPHFWKVPLALTVPLAVYSLKYNGKLQPFVEEGCVLNTQLCVLPCWCLWSAGVA